MHPIYCDICFVLPSASDILRYILSCRTIAIYDLPINLRYIYKRVSPLVVLLFLLSLLSTFTFAKLNWKLVEVEDEDGDDKAENQNHKQDDEDDEEDSDEDGEDFQFQQPRPPWFPPPFVPGRRG